MRKHPGPWELYSVTEDRTELRDLADRNRARRDALVRGWGEWAARCEVQEWPLKR